MIFDNITSVIKLFYLMMELLVDLPAMSRDLKVHPIGIQNHAIIDRPASSARSQ